MEALLKAIASGLVEKPEEIVITTEEQENGTRCTICMWLRTTWAG